MEQEHKRRVRYKGTHPRSYKEKYKELQPEKYQADVEKIIQSGKTPAGMHISIMVDEILEVLQIKPGQVGLDATLGYGGHTRRMLEKLEGQGHMYATDVDPIESEKTRQRLAELGFGPEILTIRRMNFADLDQVAPEEKFDFILADLGVSSMQILVAWGHLVLNGQPGGTSMGLGTSPVSIDSLHSTVGSGTGIAFIRAWV